MIRFKQLFKESFYSLGRLFFPPNCLHCFLTCEKDSYLFCPQCLGDFQSIDPLDRCPKCFKTECLGNRGRDCTLTFHKGVKRGAVFERKPAVSTLQRGFSSSRSFYIARSIAAWMFLQWERLKWPSPDAIVPFPSPGFSFFGKEKSRTYLVAQQLSILMKCPLQKVLHQRGDQIELFPNKSNLFNQILLVAAIAHQEEELFACIDPLFEGYPRKIYFLTFSM